MRSSREIREAAATSRSKLARGFTLVELLVVIAVIAVLAAMLPPALNHAKVRADTTVCKSNLRQWGVALQMYVNDAGVYPPYLMADKSQYNLGDFVPCWFHRLSGYSGEPFRVMLGDKQPNTRGIKSCPSYLRIGGAVGKMSMSLAGANGPEIEVIYGYGYNERGYTLDRKWGYTGQRQPGLGLGGDPLPRANDPPLPGDLALTRESAVLATGDMVAIGDDVLYGWSDGCLDWGYTLPRPDITMISALGFDPNGDQFPATERYLRRRHAAQWNMGFCDGHVTSFKIRPLFDYHSDLVLQRWNRDHLPHRELVRSLP
jgi:prepilin-type N-terminal cleavage/methylation domain-containing protein/prepilin-type processing-associated H-X9-DG protein